MPDAYDNYTTYTKAQSNTYLTPVHQQPESMFTCDDNPSMSIAGSFSPSSIESMMETHDSLSMEAVYTSFIDNPVDQHTEFMMPKKVELKIIVQPVEKFRFRYKSEMMGTHGSLAGEREGFNHKKEVPSAQLINCTEPEAVIRCTIVTADDDRRFPHAHHLVRKNGSEDMEDPHDIKVTPENKYTAMFCNMGIIHTAKKNIQEEILRKRTIQLKEDKMRRYGIDRITTKEDLEMKIEAENAQKWMNLNSVALCFEGFVYGEDNLLYSITDKVYSRPINNLKSALTGELKICRIDKITGCCNGNEEVWLLVEKVGKKNIKVVFYEEDEMGNVTWSADGRFSELDVHHQYAIVFTTPPYRDLNITKTVQVLLRLERPTDGETSNSLVFNYKPSDVILNRKRPRLCSSDSGELRQVVPASKLDIYTSSVKSCIEQSEKSISNLSGEIKKLLKEDTEFPSQELREFLNDNSNFEKYILMTDYSEINLPGLDNNIATDGIGNTEFEKSQQDFVNDILRKVMATLKEVEGSSGSKMSAVMKIRDLLLESTVFGDTPLHFCLRNEQYQTAKCILHILGIDPIMSSIVNVKNSTQKTPLHMAVIQNQTDFVHALLKLGADPNLCDEDEVSSLHSAVIVQANACLNELLNSNVPLNLDAHTEAGWSALHLAAKQGSLYAVSALVKAGANVNSTDISYGRTALHIAVDSNHIHIVEFLLTKTDIDVNKKNFGGNTALHGAVVKGGKCAEELIKILKKHGADPMIRNNNINRDEEEEDHLPIQTLSLNSSCLSTIKNENSDSDDDYQRPGESSFDLAKDDPKLMQLLSEGRPEDPIQEELDLKEEPEDEMTLQDRTVLHMSHSSNQNRRSDTQDRPVVQKSFLNMGLQLQSTKPEDEKLSDVHVNRILQILDRTGGWERLAQHTNHGSLVRLYKKMKSPSKALFVKIRLQNPDITVKQVKKLLNEVEAYEAATALDTV